MILVAQQPNYFPWLGYLEQIARGDQIVLLDDVQWLKRGWQRRARIALHPGQQGAQQSFQWLTVPLENASRDQLISQLTVSRDGTWPLKHWRTIQSVYGKRPYFNEQVEPIFRPWFENLSIRLQQNQVIALIDLLRENLALCLKGLDLNLKNKSFILSSHLKSIEVPGLDADATKSKRLVRLCRALGAQTYYSGTASTSYIDLSEFRKADVRVIWQRWKHPHYDQGRGGFLTHLSFLDVLANMPIEEIRRSLKPLPWGPFATPVLSQTL